MLLPRWLFGTGDAGAASVIFIALVPVAIALWLSVRFKPHVLGPDDSARAVHGSATYAVATGWGYGIRTVLVRADGRRHAVRAGRPPRGVGHQHAAGAGARQAHRDAGRRGARHRGAVPRRDGSRGVRRHVRHPGRGRPVGTVRHRQRRARAGRDLPARRGGAAAAGDGGVRLPGGRGRPGGQAVCRFRHPDRRRRRVARPRLHGPGFAVLGIVHRRDRGVGRRHPRRRPRARRWWCRARRCTSSA